MLPADLRVNVPFTDVLVIGSGLERDFRNFESGLAMFAGVPSSAKVLLCDLYDPACSFYCVALCALLIAPSCVHVDIKARHVTYMSVQTKKKGTPIAQGVVVHVRDAIAMIVCVT